jgi:hypothetical protein
MQSRVVLLNREIATQLITCLIRFSGRDTLYAPDPLA